MSKINSELAFDQCISDIYNNITAKSFKDLRAKARYQKYVEILDRISEDGHQEFKRFVLQHVRDMELFKINRAKSHPSVTWTKNMIKSSLTCSKQSVCVYKYNSALINIFRDIPDIKYIQSLDSKKEGCWEFGSKYMFDFEDKCDQINIIAIHL